MKVEIVKEGYEIKVNKDFEHIGSRGEIAQFIIELEILENELREMWKVWKDD